MTALHAVPLFIVQATVLRIHLNFVWAFGYNIIALPFASGLMYPLTQLQVRLGVPESLLSACHTFWEGGGGVTKAKRCIIGSRGA